ncbi:MAG: hypothetical protein ABWY00_03980 [Dongiaceae bacterium]
MAFELPPIEALLPHARPMILLDRVVYRDAARIVTEVAIRPEIPFFVPGQGIAAHVALEYMAQSCGAFVGALAMETGKPVRVGFLLGTRDFVSQVAWFPPLAVLSVTAALAFQDDEMAVFDCRVALQGQDVVTAQLTVYQPTDVGAMLASQGIGSTI